MFRRPARTPPDDAPGSPGLTARGGTDEADPAPRRPDGLEPNLAGPDLSSLPIAGLTRRHMAAAIGVLLAVWIVIVFARQVSEASAAAARVDELSAGNVVLQGQIAALERELDVIARQRYVEQQARAYGLGTTREVPFTLAPDAPPLEEDAPGSASVRLGAEATRVSPLERWLTLLFGPSD